MENRVGGCTGNLFDKPVFDNNNNNKYTGFVVLGSMWKC